MTINKITTSLIAASLLASTVMAGTAATGGEAPTFNTVYTAAAGETVAIGDDVENLELNVSSPLNNKNVLYVKLNNGTWAGTPTNYQVSYNDDTITVSAASVNADNELQFILSDTWAADTNGTITYDGGDDLNITMAADNTEDVTITTRGRDNENNIDLAGVETGTTMIAEAKTTNITAAVDCAKAVINSDTKNTFVVGTKVPTTTTATCDVNVSRPATISDIDFNYDDANVTITMYAGNLTDGNITDSTSGVVSAVDGSEQVISMYDGEDSDQDLSDDINTTLTYTLAGTATISDTTFQTAVSLGYPTGGTENDSPIVATDVYPQADSMTWELSTYAVTVLNMRNNDAGTVNTYVKLYNDDAAQDATVNVTITTADGTALPSFELTDKVPSKGSLTVSSKDIKEAYGSALDNGYSVVIGYAEVDKTRGNAVASLTDAAGKSPVRISHNRPGTAVADGYQGL